MRRPWRAKDPDGEIERELEAHLALEADEQAARGLPPREAHWAARRALGNTGHITEDTRMVWTAVWWEQLAQDVRYGLRQLRQSPGFTAVAVLSLALGIGANTAIFQLVDAVRLRSLPVQRPEELVSIRFAEGSSRNGAFTSRTSQLTYGHYEQVKARQQAFTGVLAWSDSRFNLSLGGEARYAEGLYISGNYFDALGVRPRLGRLLSEQDDRSGCSGGAVLSQPFWEREFGADPGVVGRTLALDGRRFPIVGVAATPFFGLEVGRRFDVAIPLCADALFSDDGHGRPARIDNFWLEGMGRLKPGWTIAGATAHLRTLSPGIMQATLPPRFRPEDAKLYLANKLEAVPGAMGISELRTQYERPLNLLLATTGLVLLIACANLANLLLARASVREREVAVRQALGASRPRLVRQLLVESLLLAAAGTALGALLARATSATLAASLSTPSDPLFVGLGLDWRVLGFMAALAVLTSVLFGLAPSWRATQVEPSAAMRSGGRGTTEGRERFGLRRVLVAAQVALSLVLLVGALLFVRSLNNLLTVDTGFRPEGVLTVRLDIRRTGQKPEERAALYRDIEERIAARAGITGAAQVAFPPLNGSSWNGVVDASSVDGKPSNRTAFFNLVGPGYLRTMGTPLLAGRDFDWANDTRNAPRAVIVNEEFARRFFGGANPVGRTFHEEPPPGEKPEVLHIIGLARNTSYLTLNEERRPIALRAMSQSDSPGTSRWLVVRAGTPPVEAAAAVRAAVAEVSPAIGLEFRELNTLIGNSLMRERLMAALSSAFGILAGLLATLGLYGVIAYMVARRRNEIGVRVALGAGRGKVIALVLGEAGRMVGAGLVVGLALALWAGQAASALLFGLKPNDPVTLALSVGLLVGAALLASYLPARRAAGLDPVTALREE